MPTPSTQREPARALARTQTRCSAALPRQADGLTESTREVHGQGAEGHADIVRALACTPQGLVFSASYDRMARSPARSHPTT
jgi:hypothetical protein